MYCHVSIVHTSNFSEMPVRLLLFENQKLDGITDDVALH